MKKLTSNENSNWNVLSGLKVSPKSNVRARPSCIFLFCPFHSEVNLVPEIKIILSGFSCKLLHKGPPNLFTRLSALLEDCILWLRQLNCRIVQFDNNFLTWEYFCFVAGFSSRKESRWSKSIPVAKWPALTISFVLESACVYSVDTKSTQVWVRHWWRLMERWDRQLWKSRARVVTPDYVFQTFTFINKKCERSFLMKRNPRKVKWTVLYRRKHKKGFEEETTKKRTRRTVKHHRAIVGATMADIMAKRNMKPEVRKAQREQAIKLVRHKISEWSRN